MLGVGQRFPNCGARTPEMREIIAGGGQEKSVTEDFKSVSLAASSNEAIF